MIWKYIVTWIVYNTIGVPCPNTQQSDPYGRVSQSMTTCAVYHVKTTTDTLKREFETKEAVNVFIEGMKPSSSLGFQSGNIQLLKIDSVKISPIKL